MMDSSPLHIQHLWGQTADYEVVQKIQPKYKPAVRRSSSLHLGGSRYEMMKKDTY